MYDVLYFDGNHRCNVVATRLSREEAEQIAREEARRHHAARMFLAGSAAVPRTNAVVIIRSGP